MVSSKEKRVKTHRIMLYVLAALAVSGAAPVRADDKPVTLTRTYKKGDVARYKSESQITAGAGEAQLVAISKTTVKEIKDNGSVVSESAGESSKLTLNGAEMDIPPDGPMTTTRDKSGKLVEIKLDENATGARSPEIVRLMEAISTPFLQTKEVKAGDTWETETDNLAVKGKKVKVKTTFVGLDKVDGTDLWKVKQSSEPEVDAKGAKMTYEGTFWLNPANGQHVKAEVNIKDLPSQYGDLTMKIKISRLKAEAKAGS